MKNVVVLNNTRRSSFSLASSMFLPISNCAAPQQAPRSGRTLLQATSTSSMPDEYTPLIFSFPPTKPPFRKTSNSSTPKTSSNSRPANCRKERREGSSSGDGARGPVVFPATASPEQSAIQFCHHHATTTELGGDFFDILRLSDHQAGVFICDVMGHGGRAALVTAIIRGLVEEMGAATSDPGKFLTEVEVPGQKPCPVLGLMETTTYPSRQRDLAAGDLLMLFTVGPYEIESPDDSYFEQEQLARLVARHAKPTPTHRPGCAPG